MLKTTKPFSSLTQALASRESGYFGLVAHPRVLLIAVAVAALAGCQKENIKINGASLPALVAAGKPAFGVPVDLSDALSAVRSYIQTRGIITLAIDSSKISPTSSFELDNATTKSSLISVGSGAFSPADSSLRAQNAWSLDDTGYEFTLTIYPLDPNFVGKFAYGSNQLILNIDEATAPKDAKQTVNVEDFSYFFHPHAFFSTNDQAVDGLQGELETITGPFVASGGYEISNNPVGILNR